MEAMWSSATSTFPLVSFISALATMTTVATIWMLSWIYDLLCRMDDRGSSSTSGAAFLEDPTSLQKIPLPSVASPPTKYISLILPAYNEESRLSSTMDEALRYLQQRARLDKSFTFEILVIDDGSTDSTVQVAFDYVRKFTVDLVRVIKQGKNRGKGAAVRKGMLHSRGEILLFLDSDGATKITDLEKLENVIKAGVVQAKEAADKEAAKVVGEKKSATSVAAASSPLTMGEVPYAAFGSRAHLEKQALATRTRFRNFLMRGFHMCVLLVAGGGVRDTQCGFKMFTRAAAQLLFANQRLERWCFDVELVYLAKRLSIPIKEVAVQWTEISGSKLRPTSLLHMLFELALIRLAYGFRIWKVCR